jgi:lysine biosynthesis protein LysW
MPCEECEGATTPIPCPDCGFLIPVGNSSENGEIVQCPCCGLELEIKVEIDGYSLSPVTIEGEDWGE